jgi:hypothetical protein
MVGVEVPDHSLTIVRRRTVPESSSLAPIYSFDSESEEASALFGFLALQTGCSKLEVARAAALLFLSDRGIERPSLDLRPLPASLTHVWREDGTYFSKEEALRWAAQKEGPFTLDDLLEEMSFDGKRLQVKRELTKLLREHGWYRRQGGKERKLLWFRDPRPHAERLRDAASL